MSYFLFTFHYTFIMHQILLTFSLSFYVFIIFLGFLCENINILLLLLFEGPVKVDHYVPDM